MADTKKYINPIHTIFEQEFQEVDVIKRTINDMSSEVYHLRNQMDDQTKILSGLSGPLIHNIADEILERDFSDAERELLTLKGIDRKFKQFTLLETLLARNSFLGLSYRFRVTYYNEYIPVPKSRFRNCVNDPYDHREMMSFFREMNSVIEDIFKFKTYTYTRNLKIIGMEISFKTKE